MNQEFWNSIESKYPLGKLIYGQVEFHAPFGVFVNLGDAEVKGLIQISDFLDNGSMTPEMYPDIDSPVGAVVIGYTKDDRKQVWLSVKQACSTKIPCQVKSSCGKSIMTQTGYERDRQQLRQFSYSQKFPIFAKIHLTQLGKVMIAAPPGWKPRRLPKKSQKPPISPEEKAKQKAENEERYQYCRAIFERVRPELIQQHYNWYITIDRNSGKYFIDKDYMALFEKFRNKQITGKYVTFRLNETGTCGTI